MSTGTKTPNGSHTEDRPLATPEDVYAFLAAARRAQSAYASRLMGRGLAALGRAVASLLHVQTGRHCPGAS